MKKQQDMWTSEQGLEVKGYMLVWYLYANLIRNYRILGWHPGLEISHYEDFKLPSYDQKSY